MPFLQIRPCPDVDRSKSTGNRRFAIKSPVRFYSGRSIRAHGRMPAFSAAPPVKSGTGNIPGKKLTAARAQSIPGTGVMPGTVL